MPKAKRSADSVGAKERSAPRRAAVARTAKKPLARNPKWRSGALPTRATDLPTTPRKLLEAARRVLERDGYSGLRLEAISRESGLAHSLIRYHFGSKDGLVGVLIDWLLFETYMTMHRGMTSLPLEDVTGRLRTMTAGLRRLFRDPLSYRLYLEVVAAALHDEGLRPVLAESFVGQRRLILEALETSSEETSSNGTSHERADALSAIVVAFSDGLAMQYVADPANVDLDRIFVVWNEMMERAVLRPAPSASSGREVGRDSGAGDS
jgi:AcrR family transcriptional regulator